MKNSLETKNSIPSLEELLSCLDDILCKNQNKLDKSSKKSRDHIVKEIKKYYPEIDFQLSNFKKILKPTETVNLNTFQENFKTNVFNTILNKEELEDFVRKFIFNNKKLKAEEKNFMIDLINKEEGPWSSKGNVKEIFGENGKGMITVKSSHAEYYFYLEEDPQNIIDNFISGNDTLNDEEKEFMTKKINEEKGPWSSKGNVKEIFSDDGRITIKTRNGESYFHLEQSADGFITKFITDNNNLTAKEKNFMIKEINKKGRGPWSLKKHVKAVFKEGDAIVMENGDGGRSYYYPNN